MSDPMEMVVAAGGGGGTVAILFGIVRWLGGRSITALDKSLDELKASIAELTREIRGLRDTDIRQAEQIGALQQAHKALQERVDGQGSFWREKFESIKVRK